MSILIGLFFLLIGFGYLYSPDKIRMLNEWIKDNLLNDRLIISYRRKMGVLFLLLGALIIYFSVKG
jgi:hypothetical protein